jgi:hypothetical protein
MPQPPPFASSIDLDCMLSSPRLASCFVLYTRLIWFRCWWFVNYRRASEVTATLIYHRQEGHRPCLGSGRLCVRRRVPICRPCLGSGRLCASTGTNLFQFLSLTPYNVWSGLVVWSVYCFRLFAGWICDVHRAARLSTSRGASSQIPCHGYQLPTAAPTWPASPLIMWSLYLLS